MFDVVTSTSSRSEYHAMTAILIYRSVSHYHCGNDSAFASVHRIEREGETARLAEGRPVSREALQEALAMLDPEANVPIELLDERILFQRGEFTLWYSPPQRRTVFFQVNADRGQMPDHAQMPVPPLVWAVGGQGRERWSVFALAEAKRPTLDTRLYQAPFFNVWSDGAICVGSTSLPIRSAGHNPAAWEDAFFASAFTHPNTPDLFAEGRSAVSTTRDLLHLDAFPVDWLRPTESTVLTLIRRSVGK